MINNRYILRRRDHLADQEELLLHETLFHNANGYLGVRSCLEENPGGFRSVRGMYLNGFCDIIPMIQAENLYGLANEKETMLNVLDTQTVRLFAGDEAFSCFSGECSSERVLDMEAGLSRRIVSWRSPGGKRLRLQITRMASFVIQPLFLMQYELYSEDYRGPVRFESLHEGDVRNYSNPDDPRLARESRQNIRVLSSGVDKTGASRMVSETLRSGLRLASLAYNSLASPAYNSLAPLAYNSLDTGYSGRFTTGASRIQQELCAEIEPGQSLTLSKYTVLCDSIRYGEGIEDAAEQILGEALEQGPLGLYAAQKNYLRNYWENCRIEIRGDDALNQALLYNQYQLLQSVSRDGRGNIAAKGLSGEGYEGHYFWDTEMYIMPFFALCDPPIARALIEYRYRILDRARENAALLGHRSGALFPWRTIRGMECSGFFPAGAAQYHINGDIAYAVINYWLLTGDIEFIASKGAEIVFETARLWLDLGNYNNRGQFVINDVTGPDEYTCIVNNNYYTNVLAQYNLEWAVKLYALLKARNLLKELEDKININEREIADFTGAAKAMYLPYDRSLGINLQDDSFLDKKDLDIAAIPAEQHPLLLHYHPLFLYRHRVCKQADTVLAHFILEEKTSPEAIRNSYNYYEKITTHDSSLSACVFSIMASRLGMLDKACGYFGDSAKLDLFNLHQNTRDGIHTANMGGSWMAVVYGFGGLRVKEAGLYLAPIIPGAWEGYEFCIFYRGSRITVAVGPDEFEISASPENAEGITVFVYGEPRLLRGKLRGSIPALK